MGICNALFIMVSRLIANLWHDLCLKIRQRKARPLQGGTGPERMICCGPFVAIPRVFNTATNLVRWILRCRNEPV